MSLHPNDSKDRSYIMLAFRIMGDFGITIAIPVVIFALGGKWLDTKYGTGPWLMIVGFALAAGLTAVMIMKKAKKYGREYEDIDNLKLKMQNAKNNEKIK